MGEKIVVGPINRGLRNDITAFNIDDDSFPNLVNAYTWRGRVKRKRGTSLLGRLTRFFNSTISSYTGVNPPYHITLDGSGNGNLLGPYTNGTQSFSLNSNASIVPGTVIITAPGPTIFTDPNEDGTLSPSGTINYATGAITIAAEAGQNITTVFSYFPDLPVMGLEDLVLESTQYPGSLAFDTVYSYNITTTEPYSIYDVSFYKNPASTTFNGIAYTQKTNWTPTTWNGEDYRQFYTVNYQGALWATNGIDVPFTGSNLGMQFQKPNVGGIAWNSATQMTFMIDNCPLVVGDWVFVNEFVGSTVANSNTLNFQTGFVTSVVTIGITSTIVVRFPWATVANDVYTLGMIQYLTNRSDVTKDCLRWYDGDPTNGNATAPVLSSNKGWVNFAPPLSQSNFPIADLPALQYYLIGARIIFFFKDRLLFIGPVIQTSSGSPKYLQDAVIYSQNGTPYYTSSFTINPSITSATTIFHELLVPSNQTATATAYFEDQTGFGGFITAGLDQPIVTASSNEDVLIMGFPTNQTRFVYTGNDILPFNFYLINSELGSSSTFTAINMDQGVITRGARGFVITSQTKTERIDMEIPDEVFQIRLIENGTERLCAQRDYINEWIYFTSPVKDITYKFPTQTLQYNYREGSWAIFKESYTTYGSFRKVTGFTWNTVGNIYPTWNDWNDPWNAGTSNLLQPKVIAGNQQGFVLERGDGTGEGNSLYIQSISGNTITSPDHCLNEGDFILINGCLGSVGTQVNSRIFSVSNPDQNTFKLNPSISPAGTYLGSGVIKRMYIPFIQSKQFPVAWGMARKVRLGPQQYLLTTTDKSQIQLLIFLSQNSASAYNTGHIVPDLSSINNSLIYSTVLFTCPESTNLGLTPANVNLQMVTGISQQQIWHRINTSLLGDTVQVGFTMSETQMKDLSVSGSSFAITGATKASPCVLTCAGKFQSQILIEISGIEGMTQLNGNSYSVISSTSTHVTIDVDSTGFDAYIEGGTATPLAPLNQFAEIELHKFILDVSPSQVLA